MVELGDSDQYALDGGTLTITRGDGTRSVYSSSVWETIETGESKNTRMTVRK